MGAEIDAKSERREKGIDAQKVYFTCFSMFYMPCTVILIYFVMMFMIFLILI